MKKKLFKFIAIIQVVVIRPFEYVFECIKYTYIAYSINDNRFKISLRSLYPCLKDKTLTTSFDRHYVIHTAWAARVLKICSPKTHTDISSSLYFSAIVSAHIPVRFYDYRPADISLPNFESDFCDLNKLLFSDNSILSLSCMHVIEHIGLGRYGDDLNPVGDINACSELARVVAPGGNLIIVLPVGKPNLFFNAHRVYSLDQVNQMFSRLTLKEFSLIPDNPKDGTIIYNADDKQVAEQVYGCGLFWYTKN